MRRLALSAFVLASCLGTSLMLAGCGIQNTPADVTVQPSKPPAPIAGWQREISSLSTTPAQAVVPIKDAQRWLQDGALAAYVDPVTHDEFIVDVSRDTLLAYERGDDLYQVQSDLPTLPGEPSRRAILARWEPWAQKKAPALDLATMRRTARRRISGSGPGGQTVEYAIAYERYARGVRQRQWAHVNVGMQQSDWSQTPYLSTLDETQTVTAVPRSKLPQVIRAAADSSNFSSYRVGFARLISHNGRVYWDIQLINAEAEPSLGRTAAWVRIDARTDEIVGSGGTK